MERINTNYLYEPQNLGYLPLSLPEHARNSCFSKSVVGKFYKDTSMEAHEREKKKREAALQREEEKRLQRESVLKMKQEEEEKRVRQIALKLERQEKRKKAQHEFQRNRAATSIQAWWRGSKAREQVKERMYLWYRSINTISRAWSCYVWRRREKKRQKNHIAAKHLQRLYRGYSTRRLVSTRKSQIELCAKNIQRVVRGSLARRVASKRKDSVVLLQRFWRQIVNSRRLREKETQRSHAACMIQRQFRQYKHKISRPSLLGTQHSTPSKKFDPESIHSSVQNRNLVSVNSLSCLRFDLTPSWEPPLFEESLFKSKESHVKIENVSSKPFVERIGGGYRSASNSALLIRRNSQPLSIRTNDKPPLRPSTSSNMLESTQCSIRLQSLHDLTTLSKERGNMGDVDKELGQVCHLSGSAGAALRHRVNRKHSVNSKSSNNVIPLIDHDYNRDHSFSMESMKKVNYLQRNESIDLVWDEQKDIEEKRNQRHVELLKKSLSRQSSLLKEEEEREKETQARAQKLQALEEERKAKLEKLKKIQDKKNAIMQQKEEERLRIEREREEEKKRKAEILERKFEQERKDRLQKTQAIQQKRAALESQKKAQEEEMKEQRKQELLEKAEELRKQTQERLQKEKKELRRKQEEAKMQQEILALRNLQVARQAQHAAVSRLKRSHSKRGVVTIESKSETKSENSETRQGNDALPQTCSSETDSIPTICAHKKSYDSTVQSRDSSSLKQTKNKKQKKHKSSRPSFPEARLPSRSSLSKLQRNGSIPKYTTDPRFESSYIGLCDHDSYSPLSEIRHSVHPFPNIQKRSPNKLHNHTAPLKSPQIDFEVSSQSSGESSCVDSVSRTVLLSLW